MNTALEKFLKEHGFEITNIKSSGVVRGKEGELPPRTSYNLAESVYTPGTDTIFISCTDFRTIEIIERLEKELPANVVTANQASMWFALKNKRFSNSISGYCRLMS